MSTEVMKKAMVPKYTKQQVQLLKNTVAKGTTDDEFALFLYACKRTGLDPFIKQIYAIKRWDSEANEYRMGIQVGIDGFRLVASRSGKLAGIDAPVFEVDPDEPWHPSKASVTVYRMMDGERVPFVHEVRWKEYVQKKKDGTPTRMWGPDGMPFNQLGKCAEAGAIRKAFPHDLSGLYSSDEMPLIDIEEVREIKDVTPGSGGDPSAPPPPPDNLIAGTLIAYAPKDNKSKTHRFTFRTEDGAEIQLSSFERPDSLKNTDPTTCIGKRCQFKYEEKPNPKGGNPYRNLVHFALAPETQSVPAESSADHVTADGYIEDYQPIQGNKPGRFKLATEQGDLLIGFLKPELVAGITEGKGRARCTFQIVKAGGKVVHDLVKPIEWIEDGKLL